MAVSATSGWKPLVCFGKRLTSRSISRNLKFNILYLHYLKLKLMQYAGPDCKVYEVNVTKIVEVISCYF